MNGDFNLDLCDITGRLVEFLTPTTAGLLLCIPELGSLGLLPGLFPVF